MSWSFEFTGTPEAVKARVVSGCEKLAQQYAGRQEAKDIVAVRDRVVELIDDAAVSPDSPSFNGISVKANGSHYVDNGKIGSASFQMSLSRVPLAL